MPTKKIPVAVLGATGSVGQRFIQLLQCHPWFEVAEVVASERSVGRKYREATDWRLDAAVPGDVADMVVKDYSDQIDSPIAFSALAGRGRRGDRATVGKRRTCGPLQHVLSSYG